MKDLYFWLASISTFFIVLTFLHALSKIKKSNIGEIGSFISGIISPIALLWIIYTQIEQSRIIELNTEIMSREVEKIKPYLSVYTEIKDIELYENQNEFQKRSIKDNYIKPIEQIRYKLFQEKYKNSSSPTLNNAIKVTKETSEKINSEFLELIFNSSPYKNGIQILEIKIKNYGDEIRNINFKDSRSLHQNPVYFIKNIKEIQSIKKDTEKKLTIVTPIGAFKGNDLEIAFTGLDSRNKKRGYSINIKLKESKKMSEYKEFKDFLNEEVDNNKFDETIDYLLALEHGYLIFDSKITEIEPDMLWA